MRATKITPARRLPEGAPPAAILSCRDVVVSYGTGAARVDALRNVTLEVGRDESVALWGRSGSGKTTLLHVLGGLLEPTSGTVLWQGAPLSSLDAAVRARTRAAGIAFVFQGANLLPHFTAFENVAFASWLGDPGADSVATARALLELVGLGAKLDALPAELSGGEGQRVAIARALAQSPRLLLCDEPTGHLDSDTARRVLDLVEELQRQFSFTLVVATHDTDVAARMGRQIELDDGRIRSVVTG